MGKINCGSCIVVIVLLFMQGVEVMAEITKDVTYASISSANKLDVYVPSSGKKPFPTIIMIHGGAFEGGDKGGEATNANAMVSRGFACASVNYRLSGEAVFPAQIKDIKAAIRFLRANAATYSLDTSRFASWGESAGAGLAALVGTSGGVAALEDMSMGNGNFSSSVKAAASFSPPIDFLTMNTQFQTIGVSGQDHDAASSPESKLVGGAIQTKKDLCTIYNPETYISHDDGYFWLEHGTADKLLPYLQSVVFADSLKKIIGESRVSLHIVSGASHVDNTFFTSANLDSIAAFLTKALGPDPTAIKNFEKEVRHAPATAAVLQSYPNPFRSSMTISFRVEKADVVSIEIINLQGSRIQKLVDQKMAVGLHTIVFNTGKLTRGVYFCTLRTGSFLCTDNLKLMVGE